MRRKARGGGGFATAQNGITELNPTTIELGGALLHDTEIILGDDNTNKISFVPTSSTGRIEHFFDNTGQVTNPYFGDIIYFGTIMSQTPGSGSNETIFGVDENENTNISSNTGIRISSLADTYLVASNQVYIGETNVLIRANNELLIRTPNYSSLPNGSVLTLIDNTTGEVEYQDINTIIKNGRVSAAGVASLTIANTAVTATNTIVTQLEIPGGGFIAHTISARVAGTSFTVDFSGIPLPAGSFINYIIL